MKTIRMSIVIALLSGWAFAAMAAGPGHIKLQTLGFQEKVIAQKDGSTKTEIVPVGRVLPGTEVIWNVNYEIIGKEPVTNAVIIDPVPANMVYVPGSASGENAEISFSVDGGKTFDLPEKLQVPGADGKLRDASSKDYTTIRWIIKGKLKPGAKGTVTFHATLQ